MGTPRNAVIDLHGRDGAQVSVPDEQIAHFLRADADLGQSRLRLGAHPLRGVGNLAQGGAQQVVPQPPLDPDGLQVGVLLVEGLESGDVALVGGAYRAEMPGDSLSIGLSPSSDTRAESRSHS